LPRETALPQRLEGGSLRRAQAALSQHLFYPPDAIARGLEGDVILLLTLAPNGQLASAEIARSSGHALLDQAALDAARHIGMLPGNPRQTLFPVKFRLN
jgi:protein TonB